MAFLNPFPGYGFTWFFQRAGIQEIYGSFPSDFSVSLKEYTGLSGRGVPLIEMGEFESQADLFKEIACWYMRRGDQVPEGEAPVFLTDDMELPKVDPVKHGDFILYYKRELKSFVWHFLFFLKPSFSIKPGCVYDIHPVSRELCLVHANPCKLFQEEVLEHITKTCFD